MSTSGLNANHSELPNILTVTNTKMRFTLPELSDWISSLVAESELLTRVGLFVLASYPTLHEVARLLAGSGLAHGAQNVWPDSPECTGEVPATQLTELGCTYVMLGHADRRNVFVEDDSLIAAKAEAAARAGLVPVLCVGETRPGPIPEVVHTVLTQAEPVLKRLPDAPLAVMYEPAWTIGGTQSAEPGHVAAVFEALARLTTPRPAATRLLYGGAVTPGVVTRLAAAAPLDGVGLGRAAYNAAMRRDVLDEVLAMTRR